MKWHKFTSNKIGKQFIGIAGDFKRNHEKLWDLVLVLRKTGRNVLDYAAAFKQNHAN